MSPSWRMPMHIKHNNTVCAIFVACEEPHVPYITLMCQPHSAHY
jgi:hypothetical protein